MKHVLTSLAVAAIAAGAASIAAAETYVQTDAPNGYYSNGYYYNYNYYTEPSTGTYDRYGYQPMNPTITNPGGEGGGVQNPHLGSGINGSNPYGE